MKTTIKGFCADNGHKFSMEQGDDKTYFITTACGRFTATVLKAHHHKYYYARVKCIETNVRDAFKTSTQKEFNEKMSAFMMYHDIEQEKEREWMERYCKADVSNLYGSIPSKDYERPKLPDGVESVKKVDANVLVVFSPTIPYVNAELFVGIREHLNMKSFSSFRIIDDSRVMLFACQYNK